MKRNLLHLFLLFVVVTFFSSCGTIAAIGQIIENEDKERKIRESSDYEITDAKTGEKKYVKDLKKDK